MTHPAPDDPGTVEGQEDLGSTGTDLGDWRARWQAQEAFSLTSRSGGIRGRLVVFFKKLLNPLVAALWKRQSAFNLSVIDHLEARERNSQELLRDLRQVRSDLLRDVQNNHRRISHLEAFKREGFGDVMRHSDALYAVVDQKLDRYRQQGQDLWSRLGSLLARVEESGEPNVTARLAEGWNQQEYRSLEDRFRGTQQDIAERVATYLPYFPGAGTVLDLGCGRGEALEVLKARGLQARGVDLSEEMVAECRERGLAAERGNLFEVLEASAEESLAGILCLHVIEHLEGIDVDRLVRLAWRTLEKGGTLILETPNPLSLVVAARNFWRDPTHRRPIHPDTLAFILEEAGFADIERLDLRPFGDQERLPDLNAAGFTGDAERLAAGLHELRDHLDELLYGFQDYAIIGRKPA